MAKTLKTLSNILLGILSLALSYWFYRGHLEQYVHYIAHMLLLSSLTQPSHYCPTELLCLRFFETPSY